MKRIALISLTLSAGFALLLSGCKTQAQKELEALNIDSLKTLTIMGRPDFAQIIDSLSKAYNTTDEHIIDSARAEVKSFEKMLADSLEKDAVMWALHKKDALFYVPEIGFNKILGYQLKFREWYLKYLTEKDANTEILRDNLDAFLYYTAKPVNPDSTINALQSYENIIFNMFKANVFLGRYDDALGYNAQMTYLVEQRYGKSSFKYARCIADGMKVLVYRGNKALALERLREAEQLYATLQKKAATDSLAQIPADTLSAIRQDLRKWYNENTAH